jgi:hypothetical protein
MTLSEALETLTLLNDCMALEEFSKEIEIIFKREATTENLVEAKALLTKALESSYKANVETALDKGSIDDDS